uniref:ORF42 n=1 Tax=Latid herpesvirus 1 TaxID=3096545 RepID=A0AB33V918_9VIRU
MKYMSYRDRMQRAYEMAYAIHAQKPARSSVYNFRSPEPATGVSDRPPVALWAPESRTPVDATGGGGAPSSLTQALGHATGRLTGSTPLKRSPDQPEKVTTRTNAAGSGGGNRPPRKKAVTHAIQDEALDELIETIPKQRRAKQEILRREDIVHEEPIRSEEAALLFA